ncbi:MAG: hypothetical protein OES13_01745 [Acidimicrobiia bacterium]|nr:hypothetical protein [Acidimicrobiia bacterium]
MNTESEATKSILAGSPAGRFCPSCRSEMVYTGVLRSTELGPKAEERCSNCGITTWKRTLFSTDKPVGDRR